MRIGQKNKITRRWARRGSRPAAPKDQRTASAYIFGAICPKEGKGAALVMPRCETEAMNRHLIEISPVPAPPARTPASCSTGPGGTSAASSIFRPTSRCCPCRHMRPNSTRSKTFGSSSAITGSQTACSNPMTTSSTTPAPPGTASPISRGASCPSDCEIGSMGHELRELVLDD